MKTKCQNLYLGEYTYSATGEGYHCYLLLIQADRKKRALDKFLKRLLVKYPHADQKDIEYLKHDCSIDRIDKVNLSKFIGSYQEIIKNIQELCERGGMAGDYFELFYKYNLS